MIAFTGPVRQVHTVPTSAASIDAAPHATVIASIGGSCPAALSTAMPCPFCTASTVMASGTTSSTIAESENLGTYRLGCARLIEAATSGFEVPRIRIATAPTMSAPTRGGMKRASRGDALSARNVAAIGAAIQKSSRMANTRSRPKRRNTPATMPMTMGMGIASIERRIQPLKPRSSISTPVAKNAPITSGKLRCPSAGPTSTVPGMVQKNTSGCR